MAEFTFDGLFRTTNKGLPDTSSLEPYSYLSLSYFVYSLLIQILICGIICGYVGMGVYRAFYKIKNKRFFTYMPTDDDKSINEEQFSIKKKTKKDKGDPEDEENNTPDNLIYRFDEEDAEKEKVEEKEVESENQEEIDEDENSASQETTQWYLELDHKTTFFGPFMIGFIVAGNLFATNIFTLLLMISVLLIYFLFNIKQYGSSHPVLQSVFILPCVITLFIVLLEDWNMTT